MIVIQSGRFGGAGGGGGDPDPLAADASPDSQSWGGTAGARTASFTISITGGTAPYTVLWHTDGPGTFDDDTSETPTLTQTNLDSCSVWAVVTDDDTTEATSDTVAVG